MLSYWREILSIWREILLSLQGNKHFFPGLMGMPSEGATVTLRYKAHFLSGFPNVCDLIKIL